MVGRRAFQTAKYYTHQGYDARIQLKDPITPEFIDKHNRLGKWINENAIIRLFGILDYHGFLTKIGHRISGWQEVDLMRQMHNVFTRTPLAYTPGDRKNIRLREKVIQHFQLRNEDFPEGKIPEGEISTPIGKVIERIFKSCHEYITMKCAANNKKFEPVRRRVC